MPGRSRLAAAGLALALAGLVLLPGSASSAAEPPPLGRDPDRVRDVVSDVLARPEFRAARPTPIQRAQRWVTEQLQRLLTSLSSGGRGATVTVVAVLAGLLALAAVAVRFARGVTREPGAKVRERAARRRSAAEWRAEAEDHERAGRWAAALRCRYRALVVDLVDRGLVEEVPGRTAGEYRAELQEALPEAAGDFAGATELFERAWYGRRPTGQDESARFRALADRVLEAAP